MIWYLDLLDGDRLPWILSAQERRRVRAEATGEVGEVVGRVERRPAVHVASVDEVVPLRDQVTEGTPLWQNGMPQSMHRDACRSVRSAANGSYTSCQSVSRTSTGRRRGLSMAVFKNPWGHP